MGELADRYRHWIDQPRGPDETREMWSIFAAIVELEDRLNASEHDRQQTQLAYMRLRGEHGDRVLDAASGLQQRAIAAERKAEQAWAVLKRFVLTPVSPDRARLEHVSMLADDTSVAWLTDDLSLRVEKRADHAFEGFVALFELDGTPPNPDHLERHATLLIEAGEELLRRYEAERATEKAKAEVKANEAFVATPKDPDADAVTITMRMWP